jgi:hypothetical protein
MVIPISPRRVMHWHGKTGNPLGILGEILGELLKDKPWENAVSTVETRGYWRRNLVETSGRSRPQSRVR